MIAWWVVAWAAAAELRAVVDETTGEIVHATVVDGPGGPQRDGPYAILDARGTVLATGDVARFPPVRTHLGHDGPEGIVPAGRLRRVRMPWPDGADRVRFGDQEVVPFEGVEGPSLAQPLGPVDEAAHQLDLVILSEGYRAEDAEAFAADAGAVATHLRRLEPWRTYGDLLAIRTVFLPSDDAGIDTLEGVDEADTHFGCWYGCGLDGEDTSRLICCEERTVLDTVDRVFPDADGVLVLVNDSRYGGSGGLTYSVAYTGERAGDPSAMQVAAHELGHTLVALWDEYAYGTLDDGADYVSPNCAPSGGDLPWAPWLDGGPVDWTAWDDQTDPAACDGRRLPADGVCAFPVCSFDDWVRPTFDSCMMRELQDAYCPACREAIVVGLLEAADGRLAEADPAPGTTIVPVRGQRVQISATARAPLSTLKATWTLDGAPLGEGLDLDVAAEDLEGAILALTLTDTSPWLRDTQPERTDRYVWTVDPAVGCACQATGPRPAVPLAGLLVLALARRRRCSPSSSPPPPA